MQRNVDETAASTAEIAVNVNVTADADADADKVSKATVHDSHDSVATLAELSAELRRTMQRFRY